MQKLKLKKSKAQATIEITIAFLLMVSLFFSIIAIWYWGNVQIAKRHPPYNQSRVEAGTPKAGYQLVWPVYYSEELKEEDVHF